MRVLQINSIFQGGGVDSQTLDLCRGLDAVGVESHLLVPADTRLMPAARAALGDRVHTLAGGKAAWTWGAARLARQLGADLLHAHHGRDYWVTGLAARLAGRGDVAVLSRHLMTPLSRTSARHLLRFAHVAAVSRAVEAVLQRDLHGDRRRIHRLYGGIDIARFAPDPAAAAALRRELGWPADALVFGLVANMHAPRGKGHYEFLEAAAQLGGEFPQARFLLVGSGELAEPLLARAAELGLGQRLARLRFTAQVEQAMRAIDVLVHPAVSTEALGLVIWEAMACGLPVLASRLDGIPETFVDGEHGFLLPPGDVAALRGAMARLAADAALRARLGAAARRHVAVEHDLPAFGRRAAALYRQVLGQVLGQVAGQGGPA